mmetsp:Transcript_25661/g.83177  ORF Transcript_25661/g.83177 Transcript_25661/m.83177 type:complete len:321 (+) Transcript_25661:516-1478(+)
MPMPPMSGMPPGGPGGPAEGGVGASATKASAVIMREATEEASRRAVLTTLAGSMMPASNMSTYSWVWALKPRAGAAVSSRRRPTTTAPSSPALLAMVLRGARRARWTISTPMRWSMLAAASATGLSWVDAQSRARPPPGTMPSSTAALVALRASTTRSFFSATSTSEAPPTLMTATPPESLARRSWSFSFSYSDLDLAMRSRIREHRSSTSARSPAPLRMIVSSFVTVTFLATPRCSSVAVSSFRPTSSEITEPPVNTARSWRVSLRLSPKPGALTAQTLMPALSLLTTKVAKASDSTSSATTTRGLCDLTTASNRGTIA